VVCTVVAIFFSLLSLLLLLDDERHEAHEGHERLVLVQDVLHAALHEQGNKHVV